MATSKAGLNAQMESERVELAAKAREHRERRRRYMRGQRPGEDVIELNNRMFQQYKHDTERAERRVRRLREDLAKYLKIESETAQAVATIKRQLTSYARDLSHEAVMEAHEDLAAIITTHFSSLLSTMNPTQVVPSLWNPSNRTDQTTLQDLLPTHIDASGYTADELGTALLKCTAIHKQFRQTMAQQLASMREERDQFEANHNESEKAAREAQSGYLTMKAQYEVQRDEARKVRGLEKDLNAMRQANTSLEKQVRDLETQKNTLEERAVELEEDAKEWESEVADLKSDQRGFLSWHKEYQDAAAKLAEAESVSDLLTAERNTLQTELRKAKKEIRSVKSRAEQDKKITIIAISKEQSELMDKGRNADGQIRTLMDSVTEAERVAKLRHQAHKVTQQHLDESKREMEDLTKMLRETEKERNEAEAGRNDETGVRLEKEEELSSISRRAESLKEKLNRAKEEADEMNNVIKTKQKEKKATRDELTKLRQELDDVLAGKEEIVAESARVETQLNLLRETSNQKLEELQQEVQQLKEDKYQRRLDMRQRDAEWMALLSSAIREIFEGSGLIDLAQLEPVLRTIKKRRVVDYLDVPADFHEYMTVPTHVRLNTIDRYSESLLEVAKPVESIARLITLIEEGYLPGDTSELADLLFIQQRLFDGEGHLVVHCPLILRHLENTLYLTDIPQQNGLRIVIGLSLLARFYYEMPQAPDPGAKMMDTLESIMEIHPFLQAAVIGVLQALAARFGKRFTDKLVQDLIKSFPSLDAALIPWLCDQYLVGQTRLEGMETMKLSSGLNGDADHQIIVFRTTSADAAKEFFPRDVIFIVSGRGRSQTVMLLQSKLKFSVRETAMTSEQYSVSWDEAGPAIDLDATEEAYLRVENGPAMETAGETHCMEGLAETTANVNDMIQQFLK